MGTKAILFTFLCVVVPIWLFSDTWEDPTWKEMLHESDLIALVEYTSEGDFVAKAKVLKIYAGQANDTEILIAGFSNRFGPIDRVKPGDKFIAFLQHGRVDFFSKRKIDDWLKEHPEDRVFHEAWQTGNIYSVWSPTAGDLRVKGDSVAYDLIQTTQYSIQAFYPLDEFEQFLSASQNRPARDFHQWSLAKLRDCITEPIATQYIMMLFLSEFKEYNSLYESIIENGLPSSHYALAQLLGQVNTKESLDLLIRLLAHNNEIVKGEVVRQLSDQDPDYIGPILLSHLKVPDESKLPPSNIMDPVTNQVGIGDHEIIKTLGAIGYEPAIEKLIPMLKTEQEYTFSLLIDVLTQLGSDGYIPYLQYHLRNQSQALIFQICRLITDKDLDACKPALMEFIRNHNRNEHPGYEYAISQSMGLGHFKDEETIKFLLEDFSIFLQNIDTLTSFKAKRWIQEYIEVFTDLEIADARPLIYESLFHWYGYDLSFVENPNLFTAKYSLEDSIKNRAASFIDQAILKDIQVIVFMENPAYSSSSIPPDFDYIIQIHLNVHETASFRNVSSMERTKLIFPIMDSVRQNVYQGLGLKEENVSVRSGSYVANMDDRFDVDLNHSPMQVFYEYVVAVPWHEDLLFLKALLANGIAKDEFDQRQLSSAIEELDRKLR